MFPAAESEFRAGPDTPPDQVFGLLIYVYISHGYFPSVVHGVCRAGSSPGAPFPKAGRGCRISSQVLKADYS
jgi:hypothetical protein